MTKRRLNQAGTETLGGKVRERLAERGAIWRDKQFKPTLLVVLILNPLSMSKKKNRNITVKQSRGGGGRQGEFLGGEGCKVKHHFPDTG